MATASQSGSDWSMSLKQFPETIVGIFEPGLILTDAYIHEEPSYILPSYSASSSSKDIAKTSMAY